MLANFFTFGNRNYINNAVVTADLLHHIFNNYGDVKNLYLKFKKPFFSQAEFILNTIPVDGYFVGNFEHENKKFYFSYNPIGVELPVINVVDIHEEYNLFNLCYLISSTGHKAVLEKTTEIYGKLEQDDKAIFVIYEIPDTRIIGDIFRSKRIPKVDIANIEVKGHKRYKLGVNLDNAFFGYRYNTVKQFII